jgi:hypothetical protein
MEKSKLTFDNALKKNTPAILEYDGVDYELNYTFNDYVKAGVILETADLKNIPSSCKEMVKHYDDAIGIIIGMIGADNYEKIILSVCKSLDNVDYLIVMRFLTSCIEAITVKMQAENKEALEKLDKV